MNIIIEESWYYYGDADEIIKYCIEKSINYLIQSSEKIMEMEFSFENIFFCNTDIISKKLEKIKYKKIIPDTYEKIYKDYYCRKIGKIKFGEIIFNEKIFVKPINNKLFNGIILSSKNDCKEFISDDEIVYK